MPKSKYIVIGTPSLLSVAVELYGDISGVFNLLEDNPSLSTITDVLEAGQVLYYNGSLDLSELDIIPDTIVKSTKKRYIVTSGQTLMDIAIEMYGDITGVLRLIEDNTVLTNLDSALAAGQVLRYDTSFSVERDVVDYFNLKGLKVNTGEVVSEEYIKVFSNIFNNIFG